MRCKCSKVGYYIGVDQKKYWTEVNNITWPPSQVCTYWLHVPPGLHTNSYLNNLEEEEFLKKDHPEPQQAPNNQTKWDAVLHGTRLLPTGADEQARKRSVSDAGSAAQRAAGGCLAVGSGSPYGAERLGPKQAALLLTDSLHDVSWAGCCSGFGKTGVRFASRMSLLIKPFYFKMQF